MSLTAYKPADMVSGFAVLLFCQLSGEAIVALIRLFAPGFAFPGPVIGMAILLIFLSFRKDEARAVLTVGTNLLGILSLLFVPSAVGIMQHGTLIQSWGLQLLVSVIISTILTLVVTVYAFLWTEHFMARRRGA